MVVGSSILKINPNRLLLLLERERNRDVVVITSEQLSVCVCWRRFKYFFLFFLVNSFSDRKDFGRKIANWIYHSFKDELDVVGFTWHCYFL